MKTAFLMLCLLTLTACASLHEMVKEGDLAGVRSELDGGADINLRGSRFGNAPLGDAAFYNELSIMRELIARGADLESRNRQNERPLHTAVSGGNPEAVKLLLDSGADLLAKGYRGANAMHRASIPGKAAVLRVLLNEAQLRDRRQSYDTGVQSYAITQQLINGRDVDGLTPLHYAVFYDKPYEEVQLLLEAGANPNLTAKDNSGSKDSGWTPLHRAARHSTQRTIELLLKYGANPNAVTGAGKTVQALYEANQRETADEQRERNSGSGLDFGQVIAIAGGAALASQSNLSSVQQAEFMTNYTADVLTDSGGTNTRAWGAEATQKANAGNGNTKSGQGKAEAKLMATYINNYKCPESGTVINNQKVEAYTQACLDAAVNLMKTLGCNMINDRPAAEERCANSCGGNRQCLDLPPGGASASTGKDADMDFLNSMGQ